MNVSQIFPKGSKALWGDIPTQRLATDQVLAARARADLKNDEGRSPLHLAAGNNDIIWSSEVQNCLDRFRSVLAVTNEPMVRDGIGKTPIHYAAGIGFHEAIRELPINPENVNAVDDDGNTALYYALWALLRDEFNSQNGLGLTDDKLPALKEVVRVLSHPGNQFKVDPCFASLNCERLRLTINVLLGAKADPRITNKQGETAITFCQSWLKMFGSNPALRMTQIL